MPYNRLICLTAITTLLYGSCKNKQQDPPDALFYLSSHSPQAVAQAHKTLEKYGIDSFDRAWITDCYLSDTLFQHIPISLRAVARITNILHQYPEYQQFKAMSTGEFIYINYEVRINVGTRSYLQSIINRYHMPLQQPGELP